MRDHFGAPARLAAQPLEQIGNRYEDRGAPLPAGIGSFPAYGATIRDEEWSADGFTLLAGP
jgi:hypothetical protein